MLLGHGLWDQLRVDHGKEWQLMLFMQEQLSDFRRNTHCAPHLQTTSKLVCPLHKFNTYDNHNCYISIKLYI